MLAGPWGSEALPPAVTLEVTVTESHRTRVRPIDGTEDVPLPGLIPCLTLQLNVTAHQQQGTMKAVGVLRDPNTGFEVSRRMVPLDSHGTTRANIKALSEIMVNDLIYLMGWSQTI